MKKDIGIYLRTLVQATSKAFNVALKDYDLTGGQTRILIDIYMSKDEIINQRWLEHKYNLTNPTITSVLNKLECKGYVYREENPYDSRSKIVKLTDKSLKVMDELTKETKKITKKMLTNISEDELKSFYSTLEKACYNLKDL